MTKVKPHKDEIDWLISVYKTAQDEELRSESFGRLLDYGLDESQIEKRYEKIVADSSEIEAFNKAWKKQKERNQFERYTLAEMLRIFFLGPYELFRFYRSGLLDLKRDNYKIKFRQKIILLISGTAFWLLLIVGGYHYSEYKRIQEIENADISDWENNRITNE